MDKSAESALCDLIGSGRVCGVMLVPLCECFTIARRAPQWSKFPHALKSHTHPMGLPGLGEKDAELVAVSNAIMYFVLRIIRVCNKHNVPWMLEHPASSYMFRCPPFAKLLSARSSVSEIIDQCQYGTSFRKPTKLAMGCGCISRLYLVSRCRPVGGFCSRLKCPHCRLNHPKFTKGSQ